MFRFLALRYLLSAMILSGFVCNYCVAQSQAAVYQSLQLSVPKSPTPVRTAGGTVLVYELHITNFTPDLLTLERVVVLDANGLRSSLGDYRGEELKMLIEIPGSRRAMSEKNLLAPGMRAVLYFWICLKDATEIPTAMKHQVFFKVAGDSTSKSVGGGLATVLAAQPTTLDPPLRGGPWVAVYDPSITRGHRRVIFAIDGSARIPGRFAIDWIKESWAGKFARADSTKVANWYGYGEEVLAVKDSVVAATRDDVAEPESLVDGKSPPNSLKDASGNYVSLDLGKGVYAFYEHLKPGSITVRAGDHVRSGQVIGLLGYSGDSTGPHLHFHVSDANSPLAAEGIPYVFRGFEVLGSYKSMDAFAKGELWTPSLKGTTRQRRLELPEANSVLMFTRDSSDSDLRTFQSTGGQALRSPPTSDSLHLMP
jgi:hypothetical protein